MFLRTAIATLRFKIGESEKIIKTQGNLLSLSIALGEQERASSIRAQVHDRDLTLLEEALSYFQKEGGILVPSDLLSSPSSESSSAGMGGTAGSGATGEYLNHEASDYLKKLERDFGTSDLTGLTQKGKTAYESLRNQNVRAFLDAIAIAELGQDSAAKGGYGYLFGDYTKETFDPSTLYKYPYKSRTVKNLTSTAVGRYQTLDKVWDDDAYGAKVLGLKDFKPISQEILAAGRLMFRRILDKVKAGNAKGAIADGDYYSARYEWASLEGNPYGQGTPTGNLQVFLGNFNKFKNAVKKAVETVGNAASTVVDATQKAIPATIEAAGLQTEPLAIQAGDGIPLIAEVGFNNSEDFYSYQFLLTGISGSTTRPEVTTIEGKQIRFLLSRTPKRFGQYINTSIRQLAKAIAARSGARVSIPENDPELDRPRSILQQSENDYQTLKRTAASAGYLLHADDSTTVKLEPLSDSDKRFVLERDTILSANWGEIADSDRILKNGDGLEGIEAGIQELRKKADGSAGIGRGFTSSVSASPNAEPKILDITPGVIVKIENNALGAIAREYRVSGVKHELSEGSIKSNIDLYLPVAIKQQSAKDSAPTGTSTTTATGDPNADNWSDKWKRSPKKGDVIGGYPVTSPFGPRNTGIPGASTYHRGVDLGTPEGTQLYIIAPDGEKPKVTYSENVGSAGNMVSFSAFGWVFEYLHLFAGQSGKYSRGSAIARSGQTGVGSGPHLHFQMKPSKGGDKIPPLAGYVYWAVTGNPPPD